MELEFAPFAQDYYMMQLPDIRSTMSKENYQTLFNLLQYQNCTDYKNRAINLAPVIRLYGYHPDSGERMTTHVHGYFPYFYIKTHDFRHQFESEQYVIRFIDKIHEVYCMTYFASYPQSTREKFKLIYNYQIVYKFDFYGAHFNKQQFLKLFLYDSSHMNQLVMLLSSGALMDYEFQAYESHLSYFMHFFSDLNLFGMSPVKLVAFKPRRRLPRDMELLLIKKSNEYDYLMKFMGHTSSLMKNTTSPIEVDCHYTAIFNEKYQDDKEKLEYQQLEKQLAQDSQNKFQIRRLSQSSHKRANLVEEFNVELTLTLNNLWLDEIDNRKKYGIDQKLTLKLDRSKNKENGLMTAYPSVNLLETDPRAQDKFVAHFTDYQQKVRVHNLPKATDIYINESVVARFFSGQQEERELCKKSIIERFREYVTRKKDLLDLIKEEGNPDYEFDFEQKENFLDQVIQQENQKEEELDLEEILQSEQVESPKPNLFDQMKINQKKQDKNKNRKKYVANKNNIKMNHDSLFEMCEYCNKNNVVCSCYVRRSDQMNKQKRGVAITQHKGNQTRYAYQVKPPSLAEVLSQLEGQHKLHTNQYVYFSNQSDLYEHYKLNHKSIPTSEIYTQLLDQQTIKTPFNRFYPISICNWSKLPNCYSVDVSLMKKRTRYTSAKPVDRYLYSKHAPSVEEVMEDLAKKQKQVSLDLNSLIDSSQYFYPTQKSVKSADEIGIDENLTLMIFEIFASKISDKLPDPLEDEIDFVVIEKYSIKSTKRLHSIIIIKDEPCYIEQIEKETNRRKHINPLCDIILVQTEYHLLKTFALITTLLDTDFIAGYELESKSLYYIVNRAEQHCFDLLVAMSRAQEGYDQVTDLFNFDEFVHIRGNDEVLNELIDQFNVMRQARFNQPTKKTSFAQKVKQSKKQQFQKQQKIEQLNQRKKKMRFNLYVVGRVLINIWRNVATDVRIINYSIENIYYEFFKIKNPQLTVFQLSTMFRNEGIEKAYVFEYIRKRVEMAYDILDMTGLIPRSIEIAKLYGCEYESVGYRGSQFKIESVLNRVTKQNDFVLLAATRVQVSTQKILECMPLVIEPPKMLSTDPVIVLDFQSLYPSIMIAYNLCYSTCLGNINELIKDGGLKRFGVKQVDLDIQSLLEEFTVEQLMQKVLVTPNQVAFLKKEVREGVLPKILIEFLMTRIMIKKSTRLYEKQPKVQKQYSFRQLAIKLFMNVMYGYCGASFSGRMPSGDIADSVVELGRTVLQQCIDVINKSPKWQARVLYGDTDSLFVMVKGRSVEDAFKIGEEMALDLTALFPYPIEMKFEKVYSSMFLVAKKRYVGYKMERLGDAPEFDGKGLELVRRDGCPAVVKMMKKAIKMVFETKDLSLLKSYMHKRWAKILNDHINPQDFIIAKEVKLGTYANPNLLPAHAVVATKLIEKDPMRRPKGGERLPYLVIQGLNQNAKVKDLVVSMDEFLANSDYQINKNYYIKKQINAALGRIFVCFDVDINDWYDNMPKNLMKKQLNLRQRQFENASKARATQYTINKFFKQQLCIICQDESKYEICHPCLENPTVALFLIQMKTKNYTEKQETFQQLCRSCSQLNLPSCVEWGCPILFVKILNSYEFNQFQQVSKKFTSLIEEEIF